VGASTHVERSTSCLRGHVSHARRPRTPRRESDPSRLVSASCLRGGALRPPPPSPALDNETYGVGMSDEDVDAIAESETQVWMDDAIPWTAEVESLEAIAVAGTVRLEFHLAELGEANANGWHRAAADSRPARTLRGTSL